LQGSSDDLGSPYRLVYFRYRGHTDRVRSERGLVEEAAATVSEAVLAKQLAELPPVRNIRAYLYRAFLRRLSSTRHAEIRLEEALEERLRLNEGMSFDEKLEARLLFKQILCMCDRKTMWIVWERIEGRSWDEIAHDCVMTNRAASLHYSRALREIREALETNPQAYMEKLRQQELRRKQEASLVNRIETLFGWLLFRIWRAFGFRRQVPSQVARTRSYARRYR
jgi:hypothetical protein